MTDFARQISHLQEFKWNLERELEKEQEELSYIPRTPDTMNVNTNKTIESLKLEILKTSQSIEHLETLDYVSPETYKESFRLR